MTNDHFLDAVIFDLDGVLVTTDRFHYLAWKELADELGLSFDKQVNHQLRGVSREESLKIIYGINQRPLPLAQELTAQCTRKNERYREYIQQMSKAEVLPGSLELLHALKAKGIKRGIASSSKNCGTVLERTGLLKHVDGAADGNDISASKPDPEVFLKAAQRVGSDPAHCIGVEDSDSGIESIRRAGMWSVGIGPHLAQADMRVGSVQELTMQHLQELLPLR